MFTATLFLTTKYWKQSKCLLINARSFSSVQLFAALWTGDQQAPLSLRFSRQEYWNGLPCSPPGDLPDPRIETSCLMSVM